MSKVRRIFQIDGIERGVLSVGECAMPERVVLCITGHSGYEAQIVLSEEGFDELCRLKYSVHFEKEPIVVPDPCEDTQQAALEEEETAPF